MQASTLIARALRLINVPGRGARLSAQDEADAFETLQEILDSDAVSRAYQPGIRRHFFPLIAGQDVYSYGPGGHFDTNPFEDGVPVRIEDAYLRAGASILDHELVTSPSFTAATGWTIGAGWAVQNDEAIATASSAVLSQALTTEVGVVYRIVLEDLEVTGGSVTISIDTLSLVISSSGDYEFTFTATTTAPTLALTGTSFTGSVGRVSVIDRSKPERMELTGGGNDYGLRVVDQEVYNAQFSKGVSGRPYFMLFSRSWPLGEIRFDNASVGSDILVMDVTVNRLELTKLTDQVRVHGEGLRYLRYQLAHDMAPEHGKELRPSAIRTLRRARQRLMAANHRPNEQKVDTALQRRRSFDINRGDP